MRDYSQGKIYAIKFYDNDSLIYIGSTVRPLNKRFASHKQSNDTSISKYIKENYNNDWSNVYIISIGNYSCNDVDELEKQECEYIQMFKDNDYYQVINKVLPITRSIEYNKIYQYIYRNNHKDIVYEYNKKYYSDNKKTLLDKCKEKNICICGSPYTYGHKQRHFRTLKHMEYIASLNP